jgi:hypothetical protein
LIASETLREPLRRTRTHRGFEDLAVIQLRLEVIGRGLNHDGRFESLGPHSLDGISGKVKVTDEARTVRSRRRDIDMRARLRDVVRRRIKISLQHCPQITPQPRKPRCDFAELLHGGF